MSTVRIVGDVHGHLGRYVALVQNIDYSVQIGDLGYSYEPLKGLQDFNPKKHVYFSGNHDNHDEPGHNWLGRFGKTKVGPLEFFYVGGAFSIDKDIRVHNYFSGKWRKTWFDNEELSGKEIEQCIKEYTVTKPEIVLSHDCPRFISDIIGSKGILRDFGFDPDSFTTVTSELLQRLYAIHAPKYWIFGHYHRYISFSPNMDTHFICLPELGFIDWNEKSGFLEPS